MYYFFLVILGLLPSFIWLCFFLKEDVLPEPKKMVLKIFLFGMLSALLIIFAMIFVFITRIIAERFEFGFEIIFNFLKIPIFFATLYLFFWAAIEEILKYLAVRYGVLFHPEFDEPIDAILYMIIAGLGFAALENMLIIFEIHPFLDLPEIIALSIFRFISATLLHALASGMLGYFIALSFFETKKRNKLLIGGIFLASLLHWFYNFSILIIDEWIGVVMIVVILVFLIIFVFLGFKKLKKMKSVCKLC